MGFAALAFVLEVPIRCHGANADETPPDALGTVPEPVSPPLCCCATLKSTSFLCLVLDSLQITELPHLAKAIVLAVLTKVRPYAVSAKITAIAMLTCITTLPAIIDIGLSMLASRLL